MHFHLPVKKSSIVASNLCVKKSLKKWYQMVENKHLHYFCKIDLLKCFWSFLPSNLLMYSFINIFILDSISKMLTTYTDYKQKYRTQSICNNVRLFKDIKYINITTRQREEQLCREGFRSGINYILGSYRARRRKDICLSTWLAEPDKRNHKENNLCFSHEIV